MKARYRKFLRWISWIAGVALALTLVAFLGLWLVARSSLPQLDGSIDGAAELGAPASIARDEAGVVAIEAQTDLDAAFALGFAHAQDRLFQMDAMRRLGRGRLSEVIGAPTIETDKFMLTLGLAKQAEAQYAEASLELRALLESYAAGVNFFLEQRSGALPPEFLLLGYEPELWAPSDSLVWGRIMALELSGNMDQELFYLDLRSTIPADVLSLLRGREGRQSALPWLGPARSASNNWAISGEKSASGYPLLANDPHLGFSAPVVWYIAEINTPTLKLRGATAPGTPFMVIGANDSLAWGFTTTHSDTQDLFEERETVGNPGFYDSPQGPQPFLMHSETIKVKGQDDVTFDVRRTRHGPVISDVFPDRAKGRILALSWAALEPHDRTPEALLRLNRSSTVDQARSALNDFHAPQQNIVLADHQGHIGFLAAGRVPIRRQIENGSVFPVPGWSGAYDWEGYVAYSELPQLKDPASGFIVTANDDIRPPGYPHFLGLSFDLPYRRDRIAAHLSELTQASISEMKKLQLDNISVPLLDFVQTHLGAIDGMDQDLLEALATWNGSMSAGRPEPLIVNAWLDATAHEVLADDLGDQFEPWWFWQIDVINDAIDQQTWCDKRLIAEVETCEDALRKGFTRAIAGLEETQGADWRRWSWGDVHRLEFRHRVLSQIPVMGNWFATSVGTPGDTFTINRGTPKTPGSREPYRHVHGPTFRFVVDLANPQEAVFTLAGGMSGHPLSPHYADLLPDWREGRYRAFSNPTEHRLILVPARN